MKKICKNCINWNLKDRYSHGTTKEGLCDEQGEEFSDNSDIMYLSTSWEDGGILITRENFGCIKFKSK